MKIIKINVQLNIGQAGGRDDILDIEVDDNATPEEIETACDEACEDWANNYIDTGWSFVDS